MTVKKGCATIVQHVAGMDHQGERIQGNTGHVEEDRDHN
jgi:hypothetical protein